MSLNRRGWVKLKCDSCDEVHYEMSRDCKSHSKDHCPCGDEYEILDSEINYSIPIRNGGVYLGSTVNWFSEKEFLQLKVSKGQFKCPLCGGDHFGRRIEKDDNYKPVVSYLAYCHDQNNKNCKYVGIQ